MTVESPSTTTFGLPFATGTLASLGSYGLHDNNFHSMPGGYALAGAGSVTDASLDLLAPVGTPVIPLADGTVLAAWPECDVVLVDHGGGTWVEYLHLSVDVAAGAHVTRATALGQVLPAVAANSPADPQCGALESNAPHVHFAFLSSGTPGQYISMDSRVLCGHSVDAAGSIVGLGDSGGGAFAVPDCGSSGPALMLPSGPIVIGGTGPADANLVPATESASGPTPVATPDLATIRAMIPDFYDRFWAGSYRLTTVDEIMVLPEADPAIRAFWVCAAYHFVPVPGSSGTAGQDVMSFSFDLFAGPTWAIGESSGFNGWPSMSACVAGSQ